MRLGQRDDVLDICALLLSSVRQSLFTAPTGTNSGASRALLTLEVLVPACPPAAGSAAFPEWPASPP